MMAGVALVGIGDGLGAAVAAIGRFLVVVSAYWIAAALALLFFGVRRRSGLITLISAAVVWLVLRALGAIMRLLMPCLAPDAESALGFVVALVLAYILPLRLWQRALCLSIVALTAGTWAYTVGCQLPGGLALAAGFIALGAAILWLLGRWPLTRRLWQRIELAIDNWGSRQARTPLSPTLCTVLAARLRQHLGVTVQSLEQLGAAGVHASTPVIITARTVDGREKRYFAKIVSTANWSNSVVFELTRWLQARGQMRAGPIWPSLKALVEYEHYMLLRFTDLGVPVPRPRDLYRLERHAYVLITDYLEGVRSLRELGEVPASYVERAFEALNLLRRADCAHRDIKASNLVLLPGDAFAFVDLALAVNIAGPRRLARDLANMLVVLAMHHDPARVVDIAYRIIGPEGLRQARTYLHRSRLNDETRKMLPLELPRQLRELIAASRGRP